MKKLILTLVMSALLCANCFGAAELNVVNSTLSSTGLMDEDGGFTYTYVTSTGSYGIINVGEDIYIDIFSSDGTFQESKKINLTEEKFGGYVYDGTNHYFLLGNDNLNCSSSATIYKLTKYNQSFNKMNSVTFRGSQIFAREIFKGADGLADMRIDGNYLFINDVVTEYRYENRYYQNNRSLVLDKTSLKTLAGIGGISLDKTANGREEVLGNMSVIDDNKYYFAVQMTNAINLVEVDPVDAESLGEHAIKNLATSELSAYYGNSVMVKAKGMGDMELKGFVAGDSDFIVVGTEKSRGADDNSSRIFVSTVSKVQVGVVSPTTAAITDYGDIENLKVIKLSDRDIMLMWQQKGAINICHLDGNGKPVGGIKKIYGAELGAVSPYLTENNRVMVWTYMVNDDDFAFYKYTF